MPRVIEAHAQRVSRPGIVVESPNLNKNPPGAGQRGLRTHYSAASTVAKMIKRSDLAEGMFKRRFTADTGMLPIDYVQRLRVRTPSVGSSIPMPGRRDQLVRRHEDATFLRRSFKCEIGMTPGCLPWAEFAFGSSLVCSACGCLRRSTTTRWVVGGSYLAPCDRPLVARVRVQVL